MDLNRISFHYWAGKPSVSSGLHGDNSFGHMLELNFLYFKIFLKLSSLF